MLLVSLLGLQTPQTTLQGLFTDDMVIQRDKPIAVWGSAAPGQAITVKFAGDTERATAGEHGSWMATLKPVHEPGPYTLAVDGDRHIELHNVAVGEVWICSGQSNMEFTLAGAIDADQEIAAASYPDIRLYKLPHRTVDLPLRDANGEWAPCTPTIARNFSAVGYFFARDLYQRLHVPIGIIETDWGGTPAESWTPRSALVADTKLSHIVTDYEAHQRDAELNMEKYQRDLADYNAKTTLKDPGNDGVKSGYADPAYDDATWADAPVPGEWGADMHLSFVGGAWYRRTVEIPPDWAGKDLTLDLGQIDDFDTAYVNGQQVGETTANEQWWAMLRHYVVPASVVKPGKNLIAIRVWDRNGPGGILGGEPIRLTAPGVAPISLEGSWRFLIEQGNRFEPGLRQPTMPLGPGNPWVPASLWNGMVACLPPFGIRGAVWYQGESNVDRAFQYRRLFPAMIRGWREQFGQGDFPFYFVQLANFMKRDVEPGDSAWAELREAQAMALTLPNTGMATAVDLGEANSIHPKNKQQVGRRLALLALSETYGKSQEDSGPVFRRMVVEGSSIRLYFDHATGGLTVHGDSLAGFAVAGEDRKFHWATARLAGGTVVLVCPEVASPVAVRYGWANNPAITLYNGAGLPAPPFRTDAWPGVTTSRS